MPKFIRDNSLTIVVLVMFILALGGQTITGQSVFNDEQVAHGESPVSLQEYLTTGHFGEAVFENFESEFLQMGVFVLLTVVLRQKGSPESKQIDGEEEVDREPDPDRPGAPWAVRAGGAVRAVYEHSLTIALFGLFALSFTLHAITGAAEYSAEQASHGEEGVSAIGYLATSQFWFESLQNWQSEFLAVAALMLATVWLRQQGSAQSKPVHKAHAAN